ncbi:PREDICTED: SAP domain-containing ribonucleoprotein, partial [Corvus brachyrhynchos]|uniref:SAP domain-containing ribonucleoprotein n=1 Tax=Corvus brachyrhynchos TaxID=85066 RepID=UPI0008165AFA
KGNKQDLIHRLQAYLEEHAEEEANEEDVLGEEIEEEEPKAPEPPVKVEEAPAKSPELIQEKKVVKITSEISQMERMQKRAERFNVPVSLESKKAARAARFGLNVSSLSRKVRSGNSVPQINLEKLKERAQRFGLNVSSLSRKSEEDEKLKKRKERFGIVTGAGAADDSEVGPPKFPGFGAGNSQESPASSRSRLPIPSPCGIQGFGGDFHGIWGEGAWI